MPPTESQPTEIHDHYDFHAIETQCQHHWNTQQSFAVDTYVKPNSPFYCLAMFPYPSGQLHMGHVRNYTISDVIARVARLQGHTVLHPMGWDSFGLPAENAAIKHQVPPAEWTMRNIDAMRTQLKRLGLSFDWTKEVTTCKPDYYRWEQWLFIQMFKKGLVYKKESAVNWDPVDQTVLANEQVIDGRGWRSGALVERRQIPQWFLKTTAYADELLEGLDTLEHWPDSVKTMQRHWIGRSTGAHVQFNMHPDTPKGLVNSESLEVFTTRPDTLFGVSYLAIAPEHPLAQFAATSDPALQDMIARMSHLKTSEADMAILPKEGYKTPYTAIHPLTQASIEIWVANYVLMDYGSGAVMCVPAHDQRDWEFAKQYEIELRPVVSLPQQDWDYSQGPLTELGVLINSESFDGLTSEDAKVAITLSLAQQNRGSSHTQYRLRDWGVSRQRYWGAPIPMIYCEDCGDVPANENELPIQLPENVALNGEGGSPLSQDSTFVNTTCPNCQKPAQRETDTFDTFIESAWYYARHICPSLDTGILAPYVDHWLPVTQYVGGIEHATMHLLYSRFIHKVLRDLGFFKCDEPFDRLLCQGMVLSESFYRITETGEKLYINAKELEFSKDEKGAVTAVHERATGLPMSLGTLEKMSKSKNNGIDPSALIEAYGADTIRLFSMFAAPPEQTLEWSDAGVEGASRFLKRVWKQTTLHFQALEAAALSPEILNQTQVHIKADSPAQRELRRCAHSTLQKVIDDYTRRQSFNTGIAALMKLSNQINDFSERCPQSLQVQHEAIKILILLLSPVAPHICDYFWQRLTGQTVISETWPQVDESALDSDQIHLVVQVNGKKRDEIDVPIDATKNDIEDIVLARDVIQRYLEGNRPTKVIYVPGKLVNVVIR